MQSFYCKCPFNKDFGDIYWAFNGDNHLPLNSYVLSSSKSYLILTRVEKENSGVYECECQLNKKERYFAAGRLIVRGMCLLFRAMHTTSFKFIM